MMCAYVCGVLHISKFMALMTTISVSESQTTYWIPDSTYCWPNPVGTDSEVPQSGNVML